MKTRERMGIGTFHYLFRNSFMEANIPGGTAFLKQLFQNLIFIPSHTGCNAAKCHMFPYAIFKMVDAKTCLYLQSLSMKHIGNYNRTNLNSNSNCVLMQFCFILQHQCYVLKFSIQFCKPVLSFSLHILPKVNNSFHCHTSLNLL